MAEELIDKRERYVGYATECLKLAKVIPDNQTRLVLKALDREERSVMRRHCFNQQGTVEKQVAGLTAGLGDQ